MKDAPLSDADIQAYVDGALPAQRQAEVAAYLAGHPEAADAVRCYRAQNEALRALFDPVLEEKIPERLLQAARAPAGEHPSAARPRGFLPRWSSYRMAAGLLIAVLSGSAGWLANGQWHAARALAVRQVPVQFAHQAAIAHVVYSPDVVRPVEIGAEQEEQLVTWLSDRLNARVRPPRLGALGFELIGGRLLPGTAGPVAQFMYHDGRGQRLTLYVSGEQGRNAETAFRFAQEGPVNVFYWIDRNFGYAISAGIDKAELARVATSVHEQLAHKP
ncbi:anti-sigma factor family protein [Pseudothauera rhizosphaerae]|uniref:Anti-sigma factor n=1 Tax=Pseudothauera rhizosphaerae TaxID=2565932 RepID=A0A4S4AVT3_9RHOO|nr:anti-sigma factor [Pseudothauera rhizosphaerae]THF64129.1 anti-sigma factor [Pseudothauera rhizosphaerae]